MLSPAERAAVASGVTAVADGGPLATDRRLTATSDDAEARFVRALAAEAAHRLEDKPASTVVGWAAAVVPRLAVTSSFGAESAVLLHLLSRVAPQVPVLFLETGLHFAETLDFRRKLARDLGLRVIDVRPAMTVEEQAAQYGPALSERDPETCCRLRKTEPLRRAMGDYDGWVTGVRRAQTPERATTPVVEARLQHGRWLVKVAPLASWSDADVRSYLDDRGLPRHPLVADGYPSIGCAPCTSRVADGSDPRAGRWAGHAKTECGLHLPGERSERNTTTPG